VATDDTSVTGVAGRYASALYELAASENALVAVEGDLGKFELLMGVSPDLTNMVRSPVISAEDQVKALSVLLPKAGMGSLTSNFLKVVAGNRRLFAVPGMISAFRSLAAKGRGEVTAQVASAIALSDAQIADLKATLKASVGKDVTLDTKVDPSLLGGLVVKVGSRMIDNSLKTKLSNLKLALDGPT
jgi:F-type H+-transporting ATPase subunit delta